MATTGMQLPQAPISRQEDPALRALREQRTRMAAQQEEMGRNQLQAQRYALDNSVGMQANSDIPRQVTDTSMTIPGGGISPSMKGANGSGKVLPPFIEGRYMALVGNPITPEKANLPRETMGDNEYSAQDGQAYQDAEFARSKAQAGGIGRSAMNSLRGELAGRGILGSGTELRGTADRLASTLQPLADLNVAHLKEDYAHSSRERDRSENARLAQFSGDINQRGQDLSSHQAFEALRTQLEQRNRDSQLEILLRGLI